MQPFSLAEVIAYNIIRAVPIIMLAFYPFRDRKRYSPGITALIYEVILALWLVQSAVGAYFVNQAVLMPVFEIVTLIMIAALYVAALKGHPGKMLFFCFLLMNVGYMVTAASKCLEGYLFPDLVMDKYRWSASVCLLIVMPFIMLPVYRFMKWEKESLTQDVQPSYVWQYSWLVPTTFYLIWVHEFYGTGSSLKWALNVKNVLFLLIVNFASFLIYYLILRMIRDNSSYLQLREENHALTLRIMQYEDLNNRIAAARQGRHDLRHHIVTMENMVDAGNYTGLRKYLADIGEKYQLEEALTYCSNTTVNGVLLFFSREAKASDIDYKVSIGIPEDVKIERTDLSILFGNLLENAVEACRRQRSGDRKISVRGQTTQNTFALAIDNTYETAPEKDSRGRFRSMKHSGAGIGTESVKSIVARYNGIIQFETKGDLFCVSVMLYLQ